MKAINLIDKQNKNIPEIIFPIAGIVYLFFLGYAILSYSNPIAQYLF